MQFQEIEGGQEQEGGASPVDLSWDATAAPQAERGRARSAVTAGRRVAPGYWGDTPPQNGSCGATEVAI